MALCPEALPHGTHRVKIIQRLSLANISRGLPEGWEMRPGHPELWSGQTGLGPGQRGLVSTSSRFRPSCAPAWGVLWPVVSGTFIADQGLSFPVRSLGDQGGLRSTSQAISSAGLNFCSSLRLILDIYFFALCFERSVRHLQQSGLGTDDGMIES